MLSRVLIPRVSRALHGEGFLVSRGISAASSCRDSAGFGVPGEHPQRGLGLHASITQAACSNSSSTALKHLQSQQYYQLSTFRPQSGPSAQDEKDDRARWQALSSQSQEEKVA